MRGRYLPMSFLLLAFVAGLWLLIGVFAQGREPEWRVAGLGSPPTAASSWPSMDWRIAVAALPAAAQDGQKARQRRLSPQPPKFSRIVIRPGFNSSFEGTGQPGQSVDVILDGKRVASMRVGEDGRWSAETSLLGAGDYRVSVVARVPDGDTVLVGQNVRIAIPEKAATSEVVAYSQTEAERAADLRLEAERLAEAASSKFDDFANTQQVSQRQQQSQEPETSKEAETPERTGEGDGAVTAYDQVEDWLNTSSEHYHRYVVPELARKGERPTGTPSKEAAVSSPEASSGEKVVKPSGPTVIQRAQDWFKEANQRFQDTIVRDLSIDQEPPVGASDAGREIASQGSPHELDAPQVVEAAPTVKDDEPRGKDIGQAEADRSEQELAQERLRAEEAERTEDAAGQRQLGQLLARREAEFAQAEQERARLAEEQRKAEAERLQRLSLIHNYEPTKHISLSRLTSSA